MIHRSSMGVNYGNTWLGILNHFLIIIKLFHFFPTSLKECGFYIVYLNRRVCIKDVHECVGMQMSDIYVHVTHRDADK